MKILEVIPYFIPAYSYGGPVKVCLDISKEIIRQGHSVTVATTDTLDGKNRIKKLEEEIDGLKIIRFKNISNWLAKNYNGYLPISFYFWAKKNIKNFDIVHCHDFFTLQNIIISHFCKKHEVPFFIQPHGTLSPVRQKAKMQFAKKIFLKLFNKTLKNSKSIIALTENEKQEIISIDKDLENKTIIIPNGIKTAEFENINRINLHKEYNLPEENKIIGYFGRIQYIKGIDISLKILAKIKNKINFTYLIIGPDEGEKEKLEKQIEELGLNKNVIFTGILTGNKKWQTIKSCDLFLFTSRNEGLPMTILEIATLGIPQVLSKDCHVPEIEKYDGGFEFNLNEEEKIAEKIVEIISDEQERQFLGNNSKKLIQEYFNLEKTVSKLIQAFQK